LPLFFICGAFFTSKNDSDLQEQRELLGAVLLQMVQLTGDENCAQVMHQALQHAPQKAKSHCG